MAHWIKENLEKDKAELVPPRKPDGDGSVEITAELKQWHKVTFTLDGPFAHERDKKPNPFTDIECIKVAFFGPHRGRYSTQVRPYDHSASSGGKKLDHIEVPDCFG